MNNDLFFMQESPHPALLSRAPRFVKKKKRKKKKKKKETLKPKIKPKK